MQIDRDKQWRFLEDELRAETEVFNVKFESLASFLLNDSGEMFVAQFLKFKDGEMIVRFPNIRDIPRKGDYMYCMLLPKEFRDHHNWGNRTYQDLFNNRFGGTECVTVWQSPSDDERFTLVGFRKVAVEFAELINDTTGVILVFAPNRPPTEYLNNLQKIVLDRHSKGISRLLDADFVQQSWQPTFIRQNSAADFVLQQSMLTDTMIIQGPPGTGKTYMIAQICAELCKQGKSVLVTAMTNRALMEIASKPALRDMLEEQRVMKTNMTIDEVEENSRLQPVKQMMPTEGGLMLSTYFISSGFAAEQLSETAFDYVIMDEASQALLAMFAAASMMGEKNIWVGDTRQLPPIISMNDDIVAGKGYFPLVNGLLWIADNCNYPIYQLTITYRLTPRAAHYTGLFYNDSLVSNSKILPEHIPSLGNAINSLGGPSLILTDMAVGDHVPTFAIQMATYIIGCVLKQNKKKEIALLTCFVKTTKALQKNVVHYLGARNNVKVETIARVQGLTTDITVLVIPNVTYFRSLDMRLFNVATSRAREHTIIIADKDIFNYTQMPIEVRTFLSKLNTEQMLYVPKREVPQCFYLENDDANDAKKSITNYDNR